MREGWVSARWCSTSLDCIGVPVCPHAGGVGLCEMVQHLQTFYLMAVCADDPDGKITEWVDHLHEPFVDPAVVINARLSPHKYKLRWRKILSVFWRD